MNFASKVRKVVIVIILLGNKFYVVRLFVSNSFPDCGNLGFLLVIESH